MWSRWFTFTGTDSGVIEITRIVKTAPWFTPNRRYYLGTAQTHTTLVDHDGDGDRAPHRNGTRSSSKAGSSIFLPTAGFPSEG